MVNIVFPTSLKYIQTMGLVYTSISCYHIILLGGDIMIDKSSPIPIYFQLKKDIVNKINKGIWIHGESIASERELCEMYDVSRMTIRQAIGELVQEGILIRKKGKGTYVCDPKVKQQDMMSFTEMINQMGKSLITEVVEFNIVDTPENLQDVFILEKVYKIVRKRIVDDECIAIENVFIPVDYCGYIDKEMLCGSLYKILENYGYTINNSSSSIMAVSLDKDMKVAFSCQDNFPVLEMTSKVFANNNKLLFVEKSLYRSDKFTLQVNISRKEGRLY